MSAAIPNYALFLCFQYFLINLPYALESNCIRNVENQYCGITELLENLNLLPFQRIKSVKIYFVMRKNVGNTDRIIRGAAALLILILALFKIIEGPLAVLLGAAALVLVLTGLIGVCPCYIRLNLTTLKKNN